MPFSPKKQARIAAGLPKPPPVQAPRKPPPRYVMHVPKIPPDKWHAMSPMERFRTNLGMSEDDAHTLLSIPWEEADLHEKVLKIRVLEVYMKHAVRIEVERYHRDERKEILEKMRADLHAHDQAEDRESFLEQRRLEHWSPKLENGGDDG